MTEFNKEVSFMERTITQTEQSKKPLCLGELSEEQLHVQLQKGYDDIRAGRLFTEDEVLDELRRDFLAN